MSRPKYNIYNENCSSHKLLEIISNKWSILIIQKLSEKKYRFGELKRELESISQKVLTQTLRLLEKNGLILRQEYDILPLKVEYSLTSLGISLSLILASMTEWAKNHIEEILLAQQKYQDELLVT